jgi:hypothetical protein
MGTSAAASALGIAERKQGLAGPGAAQVRDDVTGRVNRGGTIVDSVFARVDGYVAGGEAR